VSLVAVAVPFVTSANIADDRRGLAAAEGTQNLVSAFVIIVLFVTSANIADDRRCLAAAEEPACLAR
jgi:hypothetical protein